MTTSSLQPMSNIENLLVEHHALTPSTLANS
jgi:hypothetical protein